MTAPPVCVRCGTEPAPGALACPSCGTLFFSDRLKVLASDAEAARSAGHLDAAREHWLAALELLPPHSQQYEAVQRKIAALAESKPDAPDNSARPSQFEKPWWQRALGGIVAVVLLLAGKLKFLALGLTKLSTFASMFAFFGVYWSIYGWPLALGIAVSIYIHEMGHVSVLRQLGIAAGAPLFIPGVGAVVMLKQHVHDPIADARIGLAGPVWGLGAAMAALAGYAFTHAPIWMAIAELTGFINLFNLIPIWQLDGSRGFHALSRVQRWTVVAAAATAWAITSQGMLVLIAGVGAWRAWQRDAGPGDRRTLVTFLVLLVALSALAGRLVDPQP